MYATINLLKLYDITGFKIIFWHPWGRGLRVKKKQVGEWRNKGWDGGGEAGIPQKAKMMEK